MKITSDQLFFMIQVLEDSLEIQMGYDWSFKYKRDKRKAFKDEIFKSLIAQESIDIQSVP